MRKLGCKHFARHKKNIKTPNHNNIFIAIIDNIYIISIFPSFMLVKSFKHVYLKNLRDKWWYKKIESISFWKRLKWSGAIMPCCLGHGLNRVSTYHPTPSIITQQVSTTPRCLQTTTIPRCLGHDLNNYIFPLPNTLFNMHKLNIFQL